MSKRTVTPQQAAETLEEAIRSAITDEVFSQRVAYGRREVWNVLVRDPNTGQWAVVSSVEEARAVRAEWAQPVSEECEPIDDYAQPRHSYVCDYHV